MLTADLCSYVKIYDKPRIWTLVGRLIVGFQVSSFGVQSFPLQGSPLQCPEPASELMVGSALGIALQHDGRIAEGQLLWERIGATQTQEGLMHS